MLHSVIWHRYLPRGGSKDTRTFHFQLPTEYLTAPLVKPLPFSFSILAVGESTLLVINPTKDTWGGSIPLTDLGLGNPESPPGIEPEYIEESSSRRGYRSIRIPRAGRPLLGISGFLVDGEGREGREVTFGPRRRRKEPNNAKILKDRPGIRTPRIQHRA